MTQVTLNDLSLRDISLDSLPRLKELRDEHFACRPEICVELPRLMTQYMKMIDDPADPPEVRSGKRLKYILENKGALIRDDNLLAGTTTTKPIGVIIYPDFMAEVLWPELETMHRRSKNPYKITGDEIKELNFDILPYWLEKTVLEVARNDNNDPECLSIMERIAKVQKHIGL